MEQAPKVLYSMREAAELLSISEATMYVVARRGMLRTIRKGRRVLVHRSEIERWGKLDTPHIWPEKQNGKTVRTIASARNSDSQLHLS